MEACGALWLSAPLSTQLHVARTACRSSQGRSAEPGDMPLGLSANLHAHACRFLPVTVRFVGYARSPLGDEAFRDRIRLLLTKPGGDDADMVCNGGL